jgi:serine/threonine-protein kinase 24/25/MST4
LSQDAKLSGAFLSQISSKRASDGTPQGTVLIRGAAIPIHSTGTKLVFSQSNPHLKSHRRRQSENTNNRGDTREQDRDREKDALDVKYPGRDKRPGMEHCNQLSEVLYSRWVDGLRIRWPAV